MIGPLAFLAIDTAEASVAKPNTATPHTPRRTAHLAHIVRYHLYNRMLLPFIVLFCVVRLSSLELAYARSAAFTSAHGRASHLCRASHRSIVIRDQGDHVCA